MMDTEEKDVKYLPKNLSREILQNTWYKLYLLQNYSITQDMFTGANLRWSSIMTYFGNIRAIYTGRKYNSILTRRLVEYIQGLIDSGVEPYPAPKNRKQITKADLLKHKILTNQQIEYIYSSVGITEEPVDTSSAWTQSFRDHVNSSQYERFEPSTEIVDKYDNFISPITVTDTKTNKISGLKSLFHI